MNQLQCHYCGTLITDKIFTNLWGENYCDQHHNDPKCANCTRHIDTSSDFNFINNIYTCSQCCSSPEESPPPSEEIDAFITQLKIDLQTLGMDITQIDIPIRFTDYQELNTKDQLSGGHTIGTTILNKKEEKRGIVEMLIQKNLPRIILSTIVIHELVHVWIFHHHIELPAMEEEGLCEFIGYLWLEKQASPLASLHMQLKHQNPCPVYGDGFRKIHSLYNQQGRNLENLIARLKSKRTPK